MTPKEKAQELVSKYISCQNKWYLENLIDGLRISQAKQCALIAVDEIIQAIRYTEAKSDLGYVGYWEQVKQEIKSI